MYNWGTKCVYIYIHIHNCSAKINTTSSKVCIIYIHMHLLGICIIIKQISKIYTYIMHSSAKTISKQTTRYKYICIHGQNIHPIKQNKKQDTYMQIYHTWPRMYNVVKSWWIFELSIGMISTRHLSRQLTKWQEQRMSHITT